MANELQVDHLTGRTVYFLVRNTVGQIWNGSAFENYTTANLANYAIVATEQGTASAYYAANMPAAAAGSYNVLAKDRAGGSAAETDITVGSGPIEWDGSAVIPLSGVPVTATITTILQNVFRRSMSSDQASAAAQSLCNVILKLTSKFDAKTGQTFRTDGTTVQITQTPTTDATMVPIRSLGVGA